MAVAPAFDGIAAQPYAESLYHPDAVAEPLPDWEAVRRVLPDQYRALGFVSLARAFTEEQVQAARDELTAFARDGVPAGVELQFESAARERWDEIAPEDRVDWVRKLMHFCDLAPALRAMAYDPQILDAARTLLGAEPEVYQEMALLKPPGVGREKPWHQDHAYFDVAEGTPVVGVWIALDDAGPQNGGMVFQPGRHREGVLPHYHRRDWQLCDDHVLAQGGAVATPVPRGGLLLFDGLVPHGTPANRSNARRWAVQYHYIPAGTKRTSTEERMRVFGGDGRSVSC